MREAQGKLVSQMCSAVFDLRNSRMLTSWQKTQVSPGRASFRGMSADQHGSRKCPTIISVEGFQESEPEEKHQEDQVEPQEVKGKTSHGGKFHSWHGNTSDLPTALHDVVVVDHTLDTVFSVHHRNHPEVVLAEYCREIFPRIVHLGRHHGADHQRFHGRVFR